MCGIAGIIHLRGESPADRDAVRRMIAVQRHRGPDGEGFYDADGVSLGHCRLAIIDLSEAGHQPMADSSGRFRITFNGEIYNFIELRRELEAFGCTFRSGSDTEVLLAAYATWGTDSLQKLRGMFAFAIWDAQEKRLFAARDRLGIKPFHYYASDGRFAFASEIKALIDLLPERRVNDVLAQQYIAWNVLDHDAAESMIAEIHRLPAGHFLTFDARSGLRIARYWSLEVNDQLQTDPAQRARLIDEFRQEFATSISLHLRSDVPVGTCLSGGLDSSAIVCTANRELVERGGGNRQHSFSAHFPGEAIDETEYIREVAAATGCETHFVRPTADDFLRDVDRWIWHQDEPSSGTSPYAQYCVARLARESGVKVLLDGQGADEQLAGYRKFIFVYLRQLLRAGHVAKAMSNAAKFFGSPDVIKTMRLTEGRRYFFAKPPEALLWNGNPPARPAGLGLAMPLASRIEADLTRYSLPLLLRYEDRNTMAFGLESRVPFVDHVFVEWMARLPADMRLDGGWTKLVMREALRGILPEKIRLRKTKIGFLTPESAWMRGPLRGWAADILSSPKHLLDFVEARRLADLVERFRAEDASPHTSAVVFRLAMYETWAARYLRGSGWKES